MTGADFYKAVETHAELKWLGTKLAEKPRNDVVLIQHVPSRARFAVSPEAFKETEWAELELVLTGKRKANVMTHITRIVGYYSQLQNWNRSKLAELADRHKGHYDIEEVLDGPKISLNFTPAVAAFVRQVAQPELSLVAAE